MALVWNPTTGRLRPQYRVVFDDNFTTAPYMEAGTLPPNCQELIEHSPEMATTEYVFKADTWLSDQQMVDATDQLTDPFTIVPDHHKKQQPQRREVKKITPITEHVVSKGDCLPHRSPPPHCDLTRHAADNFFYINGCANLGRSGAAKNMANPTGLQTLVFKQIFTQRQKE